MKSHTLKNLIDKMNAALAASEFNIEVLGDPLFLIWDGNKQPATIFFDEKEQKWVAHRNACASCK